MTNKNYSESTIKIGTFFSGIGAPEKAFQKLKDEKLLKIMYQSFILKQTKMQLNHFALFTTQMNH